MRKLLVVLSVTVVALAACSAPTDVEFRDLPCVASYDTIVENGVEHILFVPCG